MHGKWKSTRENGRTKFKCIIRVNINVNSLTEKQRLSDWLKILPYTAYKTHACRISDETKAVAEVFCFPYSTLYIIKRFAVNYSQPPGER